MGTHLIHREGMDWQENRWREEMEWLTTAGKPYHKTSTQGEKWILCHWMKYAWHIGKDTWTKISFIAIAGLLCCMKYVSIIFLQCGIDRSIVNFLYWARSAQNMEMHEILYPTTLPRKKISYAICPAPAIKCACAVWHTLYTVPMNFELLVLSLVQWPPQLALVKGNGEELWKYIATTDPRT